MFKLVLVLAVPVFIVIALIYLFTIRGNVAAPTATDGPKEVPLTALSDSSAETASAQTLPSPKNNTLEERVKALESSITIVNKKIDVLTETLSKTSSTTSNPVVTPIPTSAASPTSSTTGAKSVYIPIGYGGSSKATSDFQSVTEQEITIDTANYPGYKNAYLEVNLKIDNANGIGEARLFNTTDGTALLGSLISTTSGSYSNKTSGAFNLTNGSKKYNLQLKSSTGYTVSVQLTRIRIDF